MLRLWLGMLILLFSLALPAAAAPESDRPAGLDWMIGSWKGGGTHGGNSSEARLDVRPALGGKFVELRYRVEVREPTPYTFEGRALYRPAEPGKYRAHWFDSRGMVLPVSASAEESSLTADWGTAGTERGRTVYRLMPDGRLEVSDTVLGADGAQRPFARQLFDRSEQDRVRP